MNSWGTARRARWASRSAARTVSSSQLSVTMLTPWLLILDGPGLAAEDGDQVRRTPQPFQAAGPRRADAADGHAQSHADLRVSGRRVADEHRQQLMANRRQLGERRPERRVTFRLDDLLLDHRVGIVRWHLVLGRQDRVVMPPCCPQNAQTFTLGRGRQPARQRRWLAQVPDLFHQQQPDGLADVVNVRAAQLVADADGPHQRGIPLDELTPRLPVAVAYPGDQGNDRRVVAHACPLQGRRPGLAASVTLCTWHLAGYSSFAVSPNPLVRSGLAAG